MKRGGVLKSIKYQFLDLHRLDLIRFKSLKVPVTDASLLAVAKSIYYFELL